MNKHEFINTLAYCLGNVKDDIRNDIVADFNEHFEFAMQSGKTEEEVCVILGDPKEIAAQFIDELRATMTDANTTMNDGFDVNTSAPPMPPVPPIPQPPTTLFDDTDKGIGCGTMRFSPTLSGITATIKKADITIKLIQGEQIEVVFERDRSNQKTVYTAEIENNVLVIKEKMSAHRIFIDFFGKSEKITIGVPAEFKGHAFLTTGSGDIDAKNISIGKTVLKTGSGDIDIKKCAGTDELICSTGSGDIKSEDSQYREILFSTGSGDYQLDRVTAEKKIGLSTGSGDFRVRDCSGFVIASSGSGDVTIERHKGTVKATTGSGDISINTNIIDGKTSFGTGSGDVKLNVDKLYGEIVLTSGSGDLDLTVNEVHGDIIAKGHVSDIVARFGAESSLRFEIKYNRHAGSLKNDFDSAQSGQHLVKLESGVGDIRVRKI